ncbi:AraC family transcriptional regulator [Larsenimonas salina]|uniref:AraC family transcriptional regulator n=1 Tax=Larsenimonas salina TaxID=1295565 RepID=UPI0020747BB4|nr:AraC family transcriptional regulator [Larsenimonas salina]MCM5703333.1 AraC family transcriptional regulator [Larsenimonas salina]
MSSNSLIRIAPLATVSQHHAHAHYQIVIGLSGRAAFDIDGRGGEVGAFQGCLVPASRTHAFAGLGDNSQLILDLPEHAPALSGHYRAHLKLFDAPCYFELDDALTHYLAFMVRELDQHASRADSDLLASTLLSSIYHRQFPNGLTQSGRLDLGAIDDYIERHMMDGVAVGALARLSFLSPAHFSALFREQTGLSPYQYIMKKRLEQARVILRTTSNSLTQVAERCGFANQSALSHAFKRHIGHTPTRERGQSARAR